MDGLVKDRTQCAPNGYYFIPVYDKVKLACSGQLLCMKKQIEITNVIYM